MEKVENTDKAAPQKLNINRNDLEEILKGRFFFDRAFSIYGGVAGLYDYGPPGCAVKANVIALWRKHFILEDHMLEVDCCCVTPEAVLQASGHVEKFKDFMVRDVETKEFYRADHLFTEHIDTMLEDKSLTPQRKDELLTMRANADSYSMEELDASMKKLNVRAPKTKNEITAPFPFNLMFQTSIGPGGVSVGYLRPELAQGIFLNFPRLLEANAGRVPFAAAQIGQAFRNEIAPRSGLLRVREFTLAEIEHFVNPDDKSHPKYHSVEDVKVSFFTKKNQIDSKVIVETTIKQALQEGIIDNQTMGYYLGRTFLFLTSCGIKPSGLRFRQHLDNEKAHYASDCWDAEILTTHGWIECVGMADRACYDLTCHGKNARLTVYEPFPEPKMATVLQAKPNKGLLGASFKKEAQLIINYLENMEQSAAEEIDKYIKSSKKATIHIGEAKYELTDQMVTFANVQKKISGRTFTPGVIEPSFGLGRIIYCIFEHAYNIREKRRILSLAPHIAPVKCSVLPLMPNPKLSVFIPRIVSLLTAADLSSKVDTAQSIGRRYARTDEIGIPYAITIDYTTVEDDTVTLRDRDNTSQIRVPIEKVAELVTKLIQHKTTWEKLTEEFPKFERPDDKEEEAKDNNNNNKK